MTLNFSAVFAVPGQSSVIDAVHPETGRSIICGETLAEVRARYPGAVEMPWEAWQAAQAARQHTPIEWRPITPSRFGEMLDVLPPLAWSPAKGFLVGEPSDHDVVTGQPRYVAFLQRGAAYFESSRPLTTAEWRAVR